MDDRGVYVSYFGRHESTNINPLARLTALGYWLGTYNPGLSAKGIAGAEDTEPKIFDLLNGKSVAWLTSWMRRSKDTLGILTRRFPDVVLVEETFLGPANYDDVPPRLIYESNEMNDDAIVYPVWVGSQGFWESWAEALALAEMIKRGTFHIQHSARYIVMMSHCDKVALILCALAGDDPKNFAKYLINRGEFVKITIDGYTGKVHVKKVFSK